VRRYSFPPACASLHTRISWHAPTTPLCAATRAQTSLGRSTAQLASAMVLVLLVLCESEG
jgi:hypothetical protein